MCMMIVSDFSNRCVDTKLSSINRRYGRRIDGPEAEFLAYYVNFHLTKDLQMVKKRHGFQIRNDQRARFSIQLPMDKLINQSRSGMHEGVKNNRGTRRMIFPSTKIDIA